MPSFIREHVSLAPLTTIGIGGPARYFAAVSSKEELMTALLWAKSKGLPVFVLGGGSNLLFADQGYSGLIISLELLQTTSCQSLVTVEAGVLWDFFVAWAVENGLAGISCLSGIPGKCGAAPIQNIGAYGQEVSETIAYVTALSISTLETHRFSPEACGFSYRDSFFKQDPNKDFIILSITFRLHKGPPKPIRYAELAQRLPANPSLQEIRRAVCHIRREKSMVFDPSDPNSHGCGSFFTNPVITQAQFHQLQASQQIQVPAYHQADGTVKLPAAWLIQNAGFAKGYQAGRVGLSQKHCLALINRGGATAAEVLQLAQQIQNTVRERFAIQLVPEPVILAH